MAKTTRFTLFNLTGFALLALLVTCAGVDLALAYAKVSAYTHPACPAEPGPGFPGLPPPTAIQLRSEDGTLLPAWYIPPRQGAVILALGGMCASYGDQLPPVGFLIRQGYGILQLGSRFYGTPKRVVTLGGHELQDAEAALRYLLLRPEVKQIGAYGFSMGGATAIRLGARHAEIGAVINDGGYFNLGKDMTLADANPPPGWPQKVLLYSVAGIFWLQTGDNPWQLDPQGEIAHISPRPVLLIFGEHEAGSGRAALQLAAARAPKELWLVPGGSHGQNYAVSSQEYEQRVLAFFAQAFHR